MQTDYWCSNISGLLVRRAKVVQSVEGATNVTLLRMRCIYLQSVRHGGHLHTLAQKAKYVNAVLCTHIPGPRSQQVEVTIPGWNSYLQSVVRVSIYSIGTYTSYSA